MLLYRTGLNLLGAAGWLIASVYVLSTGFRLARFNVQSRTPSEPAHATRFRGLPSTGAASAVLIAGAFANSALKPAHAAALIAAAAIGASALMLSRLSVPSLALLFGRDGASSPDG